MLLHSSTPPLFLPDKPARPSSPTHLPLKTSTIATITSTSSSATSFPLTQVLHLPPPRLPPHLPPTPPLASSAAAACV